MISYHKSNIVIKPVINKLGKYMLIVQKKGEINVEGLMNSILTVNNIEKNYKDHQALKGISFDVKEGEILCLLGPNGAGKSTIINIISTTLGYDKGEILFSNKKIGRKVNELKKNLGIVPQELAIYEDISAEENVRFFASLYGLRGDKLEKAINEALVLVGLLDRKKEKPKTFSGGMKRRLNMACGIAHNPKVIIMDEPTVGIDPQSRNHILQSIKMLRDNGSTIIYTTHYMEEVEEISTRIIILDHGEIIAQGTKEELKERLEDKKSYQFEVDDTSRLNLDDFYQIEGVKDVSFDEQQINISTLKDIDNLDELIALMMSKGAIIQQVSSQSASLELVFLKLTGRNLRD